MSALAQRPEQTGPLSACVQGRLDRWRGHPRDALEAAAAGARCVVAHLTPLPADATRRAVAIGAVTVESRRIHLGRSYYRVLHERAPARAEDAPAHVESAAAAGAAVALDAFRAFVDGAPIMGYDVAAQSDLLDGLMQRHLGGPSAFRWFELGGAASRLDSRDPGKDASRDAWLAHHGIEVFEPNDPTAEALASAQLLLVALARRRSAR